MEQADHHHQSRGGGRGRGRRRRQPDRQSAPGTTEDGGPPQRPPQTEQPIDAPSPSVATPIQTPRPARRARFRTTLTDAQDAPQASSSAPRRPRHRRGSPPGDDLTSTLTHALRTPPFPDCSICFNPIRPEHPTWSCSPPTTTFDKSDTAEGEDKTACCWNTFHLKCIRAWAEKSVKELEEAWRARGESRPGEWRCPGCRTTRQAVPRTYMCFCLRMRHPTPPRIATPHSCAQPCSRSRLECKHACPLPCHPGPCPPCAVTVQVKCFCGKQRHSAKCQVGLTASLFSCGQPCRKPLACGKSDHACVEVCHEGPCSPCPEQEQVWCWCGRESKHVGCGEVKETTKCVLIEEDGSQREWTGSYRCDRPCGRPFACSHHSCSKLCHPPSRIPPPCPFNPERVISCACGRNRVARSSDELTGSTSRPFSAPLPPRSSCTSPLPTCTSPCSKPLPCGHLCQSTCHWDPCPPCSEQVERTCRCGATKHKLPCGESVLAQHQGGDDVPASAVIICDKPCTALRTCGRHQCGRVCCPLASLLRNVKSLKRRDVSIDLDAQLQLDPALRALHECDVPCGRVLPCGNHRCTRGDHRGPCGVCPRGVFEELVCPCGRTVLEPPIQCGTRLRCVYPCARPPPSCGHPHVAHACHEEAVVAGTDAADEGLNTDGEENGDTSGSSSSCPPCPFLTEKVCACGKERVGNVRCSQERVSCGSTCGKPLACGFHHCERLCHADPCGTCTAVCGKSRKSCLPAHHPCTQTCHAPAACPETEPCLSPVTLTCPCGHLRSTVPCSGTKLALACTGECEIKKRNARLAEALGIREESREPKGGRVSWSSELVGCARALAPRFVGVVEKAFAEFVTSDRRTQVLPHMPPDRRKFVHDLASVYRMDTVMVDQEPHRSVQLIRRIDTRVPVPLLSQHVASSMGRLVVGKTVAGTGGAAGSVMGPVAGTSGSGSSGRGTERWNAVVTKTVLGTPPSGSATPVRVPSPAGVGVRERPGSPGPSRFVGAGPSAGVLTGGSKNVWASPSVQAQRAKENATVVGVEVAGESVQSVPDDWEDDM